MIATALLLRALCNRHDEWVLRGGAGGSEGTTCASVQTRRLAAPPRWARCRLCSEQAGWLHAGAPPGSSWEHFSASLEMKVRQFFCHVRKQQPVVSQGPKDKCLFFQAKMAKSKVWEHGHGVVSLGNGKIRVAHRYLCSICRNTLGSGHHAFTCCCHTVQTCVTSPVSQQSLASYWWSLFMHSSH